MTNNYLLKLSKKHKNHERVPLAKSKQVFIFCNQFISFNGTDLSWVLKVGRKSFIQSDSSIFRFHFLFFNVLSNNFTAFLSHIAMVFLDAVFEHVRPVISSIVVLIRSCMQRAVSPM